MNGGNLGNKSIIGRFNFKCTYGVNNERELERKVEERGARVWVKNGARNRVEECGNREFGVHDVSVVLFSRGVDNVKRMSKEELKLLYKVEWSLVNNSKLSEKEKAVYSRISFTKRFQAIIFPGECFGNIMLFDRIKHSDESKDEMWKRIKSLEPAEKKCLELLGCRELENVRCLNNLGKKCYELFVFPVLYLLKRGHELPVNLGWDRQKLLSLDEDIEGIFEESGVLMEGALSDIKFFESVLRNSEFKPKVTLKHDVINKEERRFFEQIVYFTKGNFPASKKNQLKTINGYLKIDREYRRKLLNNIFLPTIEYVETNIENIKGNKLRPCKLNAYVAFIGWLIFYRCLDGEEMEKYFKGSLYQKELRAVINLCKNAIVKIVKRLHPYAVEVKRFLGQEKFGLVDELHLKSIFNGKDEIDETTKEFEEYMAEELKKAEEEIKEKENKREKRKNKQTSTNVIDANWNPKVKDNKNKLEGSSSQQAMINEEFEEEKERLRELEKIEEEKRRKVEIRKRLEEAKVEREKKKQEREMRKMERHKDKVISLNNTNEIEVKIESRGNVFEMPTREEVGELVIENLNNNNLRIFNSIFNINGCSSDYTLTHFEILSLGEEINWLLTAGGFEGCGQGLLEDLNKHKHPNHGGGEGFKLPKNYVDIMRSFFIVNGIMPEKWEAGAVVDLKAFHLYSLRVGSFRDKK